MSQDRANDNFNSKRFQMSQSDNTVKSPFKRTPFIVNRKSKYCFKFIEKCYSPKITKMKLYTNPLTSSKLKLNCTGDIGDIDTLHTLNQQFFSLVNIF